MRIIDLLEQQSMGTIGSTVGATQPVGQTPSTSQNTSLSGNVQALNDPKMKAAQAAALAQQKKDRENQKKQVADQIKALQQQLQSMQKQQQDLNKIQ